MKRTTMLAREHVEVALMHDDDELVAWNNQQEDACDEVEVVLLARPRIRPSF